MQVTIIPSVIGAFGTVTKGLLKGLEGLEVGGDHPNDSKKPSANADTKSSNDVNDNNSYVCMYNT